MSGGLGSLRFAYGLGVDWFGQFWLLVRTQNPRLGHQDKFNCLIPSLESHFSAIGDTISCDAPYCAVGFRGKLFLQYPPQGLSLACARPSLLRKEVGVVQQQQSAIPQKTQCDRGIATPVSRQEGIFGRVTKQILWRDALPRERRTCSFSRCNFGPKRAILRDGETTIKIKNSLLRAGGGLGGRKEIVQKRCFSRETPRQ